ncbi:hypothetical protein GALMADRAFT_213930 [Galerina marginata CBS 339.88]|uniref:Uncharacterized protein n=1 Tax=Galerina marginata (strain CBS 339.88) TaxID=685588 RepID=A0A067SWQ7_GALM3|nr:hypothetical protein GALMADRAFT_213930 [Galerina marginata CBS 339.88]
MAMQLSKPRTHGVRSDYDAMYLPLAHTYEEEHKAHLLLKEAREKAEQRGSTKPETERTDENKKKVSYGSGQRKRRNTPHSQDWDSYSRGRDEMTEKRQKKRIKRKSEESKRQ